MATRQEFVDAMIEVWKNHGVYIGTANGELTTKLEVGQIAQMEVNYGYDRAKTNTNIRRDLSYIGKCYDCGYDMSKSRAGDCSGIIVGVMRDLGIISKTADYRAKDFQAKSKPISLKELQPGDLLFDKTKDAGHIGVYIGDSTEIDSRGRDVGLVKKPLTDYSWKAAGRLDWFSDDIPVLTRNLRYVKDNLMRGQDVKECQEQLKKKGYDPGAIDGIYGVNTLDSVIEFQTENGLEVDGVVGQKTWAKLWD